MRENGRMRPGNQNKQRMRGRGRKGPNPLTRTFESNGPDVKIRGTALHIAEKYQQLARDAQASGDRVMSENYYQHAEHYLRIVAAAQGQTQPATSLQRFEEAEDESEYQEERREPHREGAREAPAGRSFIPVDAPQPFVDQNPGLNIKPGDPGRGGATNGAYGAQHGSEEGGEEASSEETEENHPRRRMRGARGRGNMRGRGEAPQDAPSENRARASEAPVRDVAVKEAESDGDSAADNAEEPERKPRARRTTRARTTKKADSENPAATEA